MKRKRLLLVNPWVHDFSAYDLWAKPLGLLILATHLRKSGWDPSFVDCLDPDHPGLPVKSRRSGARGRFHRTEIPKPDALKNVPRTFARYGAPYEVIRADLSNLDRPDAALITSMMTYWRTGLQETTDLIREIFPGLPVLLGGIFASIDPHNAMKSCNADRLIRGPGEFQVNGVLGELLNFSLKHEPDAPIEFSPALDLLTKVRFIPLLTSRGCPFSCHYCASKIVAPFFIQRPVGEVLKELKMSLDRYGCRDIAIYDDAFLVNSKDHALKILEPFESDNPDLSWHCPNGLHARAIDSRVARSFKRAGFKTIRIGLESSSDTFNKSTGGKTSREMFAKAVWALREAGFTQEEIGAYLLVGLPNQTCSQIEEDVRFVLETGAHPKLAEYSPIPGTSMWEEALRKSVYPIKDETLFQNCTLLPTASTGVDSAFLSQTRRRVREALNEVNINRGS